ncbi:BREX-1 system adenine-specific DNA-methyltransferase PglX [Tetragenococcus halophilus]|uniref:BREX-1 system adenine-specific DNA-methyltransferase PglX n=1 Tax=Tetragenococcus halophilus TaxID=51669 RepID=UPI002561F5B8|nr:BREX-1 system adenine-specific DNA-methyltransferase PglX [Tetragenococcus halophilus]GMG63870.1 BREX-1 system adenine-specific DNA-methyltransferase PglX [Tetragenococcus halophilus]
MDRKAIKSFAVNARRKLINEVTRKASLLGINNEHIKNVSQIDKNLQEVAGTRIQGKEITQRKQLVNELYRRETNSTYQEAFQGLIDEVAYTWFNRLIAIRFMEVNDYLPDMYRILSSESIAKTEPDIITDIYETDLYEEMFENEKQQVQQWKNDGSSEAMDQLYQLVFVKICNQLNNYLPELFEPIEDYTELLFTASYIKEDGVIRELLAIPEEDFDVSQGGQVEIIGWLYQYYNSEPKDQVFSRPKSEKISSQDIPAATQLFTPDWIVRYMVENSLGRFYIEKMQGQGDVRSEKAIAESFGWNYYLETAEQPSEVVVELKKEQKERVEYDLPQIKFMDPSMGSGHILVYALDVFIQLYENEGYSVREAVISILENNLFGLDIDYRAKQLAYFALMMKGRQYNRQILKQQISLNIFDIPESKEFQNDENFLNELEASVGDDSLYDDLLQTLQYFNYGKDYGSLIRTNETNDFNQIIEKVKIYRENQSNGLFKEENCEKSSRLIGLLEVAKVLSSKYEIVCTNPPYMGNSGMNKNLTELARKKFSNSKRDLFAMFMEQCKYLMNEGGYCGMITQQAWMFLSSYEKLRSKFVRESTIINMANLGARAFEEIGGEVVQTTSFIIKTEYLQNYNGTYVRLVDYSSQSTKEDAYIGSVENKESKIKYIIDQSNFKKIPGMPIAYWANVNITNAFTNQIKNNYHVLAGISTGNNEKYLKFWHEINFSRFKIDFFPISKGGNFRRWYGNNKFVINYTKQTIEEMEKLPGFRHDGKSFYFKEMLSWSKITSGKISVRKYHGAIFDSSAPAIFPASNYLLGFLNSKVASQIMGLVNPTLNSPPGYVSVLPDPYFSKEAVEELVEACVNLSINDWNAFENSWNFSTHPFLLFKEKGTLKEAFNSWNKVAERRFQKLKNTEEKLNLVFIELYNLTEDISPEIEDREVTVNKGNLLREIVSFISYAIGCMFGRYSLDEDGIIYAGGDWAPDCFQKFKPDKNNVLLITDNEYFRDSSMDIVNRFIDFVETTFGRDTLEENLQFIADTLGGKGTSREILRRYFVKDFYKDHLKTYQKRPIYWQLDSGKQDGFKALIYLHRYTPDQLGKVRTDYLHELQKAYNNRIELRTQQIQASENQKEINSMQKEIAKVQKQLKEIREYDEKLSHLALQRIELDLDDGVVVNYDKLQRAPDDGKKYSILAKGVKEPKK